MKSKMILVGAVLAAGPVSADTLPDICKTAINYTAIVLDVGFADGSFADKYDPSHIKLSKNLNRYPITNVTYLGDCDGAAPGTLKDSWCNVAGGPAAVWKVEVSAADSVGGMYPTADMVVTYNRGGCHVDEAAKK